MLIAQLIGIAAFFVGIYGFLQKDDIRFRVLMALYCFVMAVHFFLLGTQGTAVNVAINGIRNLVSIKSKSKWMMLAFIGLILMMAVPNIEQWYEIPPVIGSLLTSWALFSITGVPLRLILLSSSCCWLLHNVLAGSIGGSLIEASFVVSNGISIYRMIKESQVTPAAQG
ncbi:YgjV family protein [Parendozoicomonas haliclonae]|uniref:Inner membrane protein YgjV n=2 Tax=Parendozoicomonas haliclonae TaxID=1960125 RepID=A0A1X7AG91_9GAMM|nr:Inner membrane protein YgjV [Parendozoicomonas haliclonae]